MGTKYREREIEAKKEKGWDWNEYVRIAHIRAHVEEKTVFFLSDQQRKEKQKETTQLHVHV